MRTETATGRLIPHRLLSEPGNKPVTGKPVSQDLFQWTCLGESLHQKIAIPENSVAAGRWTISMAILWEPGI